MTEGFQHIDAATARDHLTQRYATSVDRDRWEGGIPLAPAEALGELCRAERGEPTTGYDPLTLPVPRRVDVAAGLSLLPAIRDELDRQELLLILGARARGAAWSAIAETLGLESRQAAEQRCRRLRERWPDVTATAELAPGANEDGDVLVPRPGHLRIDLMDPDLLRQEGRYSLSAQD
jgi:hypothetical protein